MLSIGYNLISQEIKNCQVDKIAGKQWVIDTNYHRTEGGS